MKSFPRPGRIDAGAGARKLNVCVITIIEKEVEINKEKFLLLIPGMTSAARNLGYAIAVHGSLSRDYDLIAVPWVIGASDPDYLAAAIFDAAGGKRWRVWWNMGGQKPYGRRCYAFDWGEANDNRDYCDLSVTWF